MVLAERERDMAATPLVGAKGREKKTRTLASGEVVLAGSGRCGQRVQRGEQGNSTDNPELPSARKLERRGESTVEKEPEFKVARCNLKR